MTKGLDILHGITMVPLGKAAINGAGGGGISKKRIIIKSDTIPEASAKTYKLIYIYSGESDGTYHHGYIYECIADVTYSLDYTGETETGKEIAFSYNGPAVRYTFTSDSEAMQAWLRDIVKLSDLDVSYLQVAGGSIVRRTADPDTMWLVTLTDKNGNILYQTERGIYKTDLTDYGFEFMWPDSNYHVDEPTYFTLQWNQDSISNYRWEQLDVQPGGSSGDMSIYQLKANISQDYSSTSIGTYPSSKALSEAIDSVKNTLTLFDGNTGTVLDTSANLGTVIIFKNGQQIYAGADRDYTINGSIITFTEPLVESDVIAVVNNNLVGLQLSSVATSGDYNDLINKPVMSFSQVELTKVTANDTFVDLAQEIQNKNLPTGTILYGEVYNTPKPAGINNAEVKVEILDTKTSGQYTGKQVLEFTLYSSDIAPYQWAFVYYQPNYEQNQQTWEWHGIGGGGSSDYTDLTNKPSINSVTLSENKTSEDLGLVPAPTVVNNGDNTGLVIEANKIYKFATALTALTITSAEVSDYESRIYFTTGGTIAFTNNSNLKWGGNGYAPSLEINTRYCIAICNGLAEIDSFGNIS